MGLLSASLSLSPFQVLGEFPGNDLFEWAGQRLSDNRFRPIDQSSDELSVGWVHLDDFRLGRFDTPEVFWRDHYLVFSLRRDQRRIPAALAKSHLQKAEEDFLSAHPGLHRVPKAKREELRDAVRGALFARVLPTPTVTDIVWDTRSGRLWHTTLGTKMAELFENLFKQTFDGLRLVPVHPLAKGRQVLSEDLLPALEQANRAKSDEVLDLIRENHWLGWDFFRWLMFQTMNESSEYTVNQPGPALAGDSFVAYIDDRLVLQGEGEGGVQKITVAGPQDSFGEVRTALQSGKQVVEAALYLEQQENLWKMALRGEMFHFAGFKTPGVKVERVAPDNESDERIGAFLEKMALLEKGFQLFDSLFSRFLHDRLGPDWSTLEGHIREWLEGRYPTPQ
jgi:hypothetical protein